MENATKARRLDYLRWRLGSDAECATGAMLKVADRHTALRDGRGFGTSDEILLSFARQVLTGRTLSPRQTEIMFRKMPKYAGQLMPLIPEDRLLKAMWHHRWIVGPGEHLGPTSISTPPQNQSNRFQA